MCGHRGCQGLDAVGELRQERSSWEELAPAGPQVVATDDQHKSYGMPGRMVSDLLQHVNREEQRTSSALCGHDEFSQFLLRDHALEAEHFALDGAIAASTRPPRTSRWRLLNDFEHHKDARTSASLPSWWFPPVSPGGPPPIAPMIATRPVPARRASA